MTLKLQDILHFDDSEIDNIRVRFTMSNGIENPLDIYMNDKEKINVDWFLHSGKKYNNFKKGVIAISLLKVGEDLWLLTTIKKILEVHPPKQGEMWTSSCYETEVVEKYRNLFDRTLISYHKKNQSGKYIWKSVCDDLLISKITAEEFNENTFRGYKFELSFSQLETIVKTNRMDWVEALNNIQAVYLITDNLTGKFYVGSASSSTSMLFGRWKDYVKNGHGGNEKLKELVEKEGIDYIKKNFSYRILDYFSVNYPQAKVLESESYWKDVFKSRKFGYNMN